ncbi:MAG: thermonuclease family protein [Pseudomonadota bacterium]|nr:thermonuclease family protein [Pseudomonadota bacterium]
MQQLIRRGRRSGCAAVLALEVFVSTALAQAPAMDRDCLAEAAETRVAAVIDARSVKLEDGRVLRLAGIETFALLLDSGDDAEATLRGRLETMLARAPLRVVLLTGRPDRHGRLSALVAAADGALVQEVLAREGLALAVAAGDPLPCFARFLSAENSARRAGRGFWAGTELPEARPDTLKPRIGRFAIFEGAPISVGNRPTRTYLNFGTWWSEDVTVEIPARDRALFGGEAALAQLAGRRLRIRGFVEDKGGPMVVIRSPMQMETLGAAAAIAGETP